MKHLLLLIVPFFFVFACPNTEMPFQQVMSIQYAKTIDTCSRIVTTAEFVGLGSAYFRVPNKLRSHTVFRCTAPGVTPESVMGTPVGNFCFISPQNTDTELLYKLKTGDKIKLVGKVWVNNNFGYEQSNFICDSLKIL